MIDQKFHGDQHVVEEQRMRFCHEQAAVRRIVGRRALAHEHRCGRIAVATHSMRASSAVR